jgi:hypothetical protein
LSRGEHLDFVDKQAVLVLLPPARGRGQFDLGVVLRLEEAVKEGLKTESGELGVP